MTTQSLTGQHEPETIDRLREWYEGGEHETETAFWLGGLGLVTVEWNALGRVRSVRLSDEGREALGLAADG